ncbi:leucyl aminopeptidase family protein [Roseibium denhamense]|uniref:Leucyl aminopeptidase n=1 Tax=Roseibium denhamense TaxID=76305 RepID=A0ABY1P3B8_9HYPH|nr:leucyl aminopeptidase family protein [Roseibium denhamense]MTI04918.1 leucyl aminopeptidase family protein [Roseibium denhamense]SMP23092.1 leucyl aminopeptidase [Roseibium denhamense]
MRQSLVRKSEVSVSTPIIGVTEASLEDVLAKLGEPARAWCTANGFTGTASAFQLVPGLRGEVTAVLFGLSGERLAHPFSLGSLVRTLPEGDYHLDQTIPDHAEAALGFALSSYVFDKYKAQPAASRRIAVSDDVDLDRISVILEGVQLARDLINIPANDLGPEELAKAAGDLFNAHGGTGRVVVGENLLGENFPMVHAVGRASSRLPRLADYTWGKEDDPKVTLVGKGVIFDTGGLNIKPGNSMALMKKDMGGAANVLGLAAMIMAAELPVRLRVIIPCVENAIAGNAFRPGDVLPSRKGITVEIGNTDAEGRLILADALALADEEHPDLLLDMATLTGAARVALGPDLPPFYTHDEELAEDISVVSEAVSDPLWRLPLWQPYMSYLDSKVADINHINTSGTGFAGSITAALFLSRFVENSKSWAHFDIYGWTPMEKPGKPSGGEAQGIRTLFSLIEERFSKTQ